MNTQAYAFGADMGEKMAAGGFGAFGKMLGGAARKAVDVAAPVVKSTAKRVADNVSGAASGAATAARGAMDNVANTARTVAQNPGRAAGQAVRGVADTVATGARRFGEGVGSVGQFTMNTGRRGLNAADDAARYAMNGPGRAAATGQRLGDQTIGRTQAMGKQMFGTSAMTDKLNPLNLAVGAGTLGAGAHYANKGLESLGGGVPSSEGIAATQDLNENAQRSMAAANPNAGAGSGLMGMWNNLPVEARYAIGAGVPLALAGAFMGGRGNGMLGAGMGALGLGAAGLGAAGAGMFGDGARRMVGQGANALYNMTGGGGGDIRGQLDTLGSLSPEFGTTALMGRDPNMSSEQARGMYDFLTQNRGVIDQLLPQLQANSVSSGTPAVKAGAAIAEKLAGRCWTGYEPVPGKKPYSNDSCRPVGKKKKKTEKKAEPTTGRGQTSMNLSPSSRGNVKPVDDKQKETQNPVPTDAENEKQPHAN
jgi:hypothetical protein